MNSKDLAMLNRLKKIASGGGGGGQVDTSYVDAQDAKTLSDAKTYTDNAVKNKAEKDHVHDQYITEHQDISGKAEKTDLNAHTGDTTVHITSSERTKWNNKSEFSGNYNDLTNKPTIQTVPTNVSAFINDAGYLTEHQDISGKANVSDLTSHTGNKSNPHGVTKAQVGLGNVENKSSATIRSEITKTNVTDALGFIPAMSGSSASTTHITLPTSGWTVSGDTYSQTANISGMTATSIVLVTPDMSNGESYSEFGVVAVAQGSGTLTFKAYILPDVDLKVGVVNLGEES